MPRTPPWLQSILEEHFEELQMLWELRLTAVRDEDYVAEDLAELDERIEAHTDGLVLGEEHARPLLEEGLGSDEASVVFASAYVLLRLGRQETADKVMEAFDQAEDEALDGFREAFCYGPIRLVALRLQEMVETAPSARAAVAAEALAFHGGLSAAPARLDDLFQDDAAQVRRSAWRMVAMFDR